MSIISGYEEKFQASLTPHLETVLAEIVTP